MRGMKEMKGRRSLVEEFSPAFCGLCTVGGILSAGTAHLAITPLDVLKVNMKAYLWRACQTSGRHRPVILKSGESETEVPLNHFSQM